MQEVVNLLIAKQKTVSTMESCTGGGIANSITNIPDASKVFNFSAITYSNEFKIKFGVSEDLIKKYSVYSPEVASNMAYCISNYTNSNYGIGVTGKLNKIDSNNMYGDDDMVYIAIYDKDQNTYYHKKVQVTDTDRAINKNIIIAEIIQMFKNIIVSNQ